MRFITHLGFNEEQLIKKLKVALSGESAISRYTDSEYAALWEQEAGIGVIDAPIGDSNSPSVLTVQQHMCPNEG